MNKWSDYKVHILILRAAVLVVPASIALVIYRLNDYTEAFIDWLDNSLPDPRKKR